MVDRECDGDMDRVQRRNALRAYADHLPVSIRNGCATRRVERRTGESPDLARAMQTARHDRVVTLTCANEYGGQRGAMHRAEHAAQRTCERTTKREADTRRSPGKPLACPLL